MTDDVVHGIPPKNILRPKSGQIVSLEGISLDRVLLTRPDSLGVGSERRIPHIDSLLILRLHIRRCLIRRRSG